MNSRNSFILASLAACISVLVSGCGKDAQDASLTSQPGETQTAAAVPSDTVAVPSTSATPSPNYRGLRASAVIGKEVRNPQGGDIGKINDLIVDMNTGDVRYAILEFDPGVFQGDRLFAVPTNELRMATDRDDLVYNMTRDRLESVGVDRAEWSRTAGDLNYLTKLDKAWGVVQPSSGARAQRVTELLAQDVNSRQGNKIGEIEELVIDMANQKVHYVVLEFDSSWSAPEKLYAFPLTVFNRASAGDDVVLDVDRSRIQDMKAFPDDRYSSLNDPDWVVDVDRYFVTVLPTLVASRADEQSSGSQALASNSPRPARADRN